MRKRRIGGGQLRIGTGEVSKRIIRHSGGINGFLHRVRRQQAASIRADLRSASRARHFLVLGNLGGGSARAHRQSFCPFGSVQGKVGPA
jgi:hypothetical protein